MKPHLKFKAISKLWRSLVFIRKFIELLSKIRFPLQVVFQKLEIFDPSLGSPTSNLSKRKIIGVLQN